MQDNESDDAQFIDKEERRVVFSNPELRDVEQTLTKVFGAQIANDEQFEAAAALTGDYIEMVIAIVNHDRTRVCRLQGVTEVDLEGLDDFLEVRADLFEFLTSMVEEYLQTSQLRALHIDWRDYEYNNRRMKFRSSLENEKVREMADEWLKEHDPDFN